MSRALSEFPFQQTNGESWDDIYATLTDFEFLEAKAAKVGVVVNGDGTTTYTGVHQLQDDYALALAKMPGGDSQRSGRRRVIVTAVDLGSGLEIRCPHCNRYTPLRDEWRGADIVCPYDDCRGPLRRQPFRCWPRSGNPT